MQGNKYCIRTLKSWGRQSKLIKSRIKYGQVLIFCGHFINGLAINNKDDITRVALEFCLFKKDK